jgi:hypothetical protein
MDERGMDHGIGRGDSTPQAVQIFNIPAMDSDVGTRGGKRLGARFRPREAEHLMTCVGEFANNGRTDKTRSTG